MPDEVDKRSSSLLAWAIGTTLLIIFHILIYIANSPTISAVISLLAGSGVEPPIISKASIVAVYLFGFYYTLSNLGSVEISSQWQGLAELFADRGITGIFVVLSVSVAMLLSIAGVNNSQIAFASQDTSSLSQVLLLFGVALIGGTSYFILYIDRYHNDDIFERFAIPVFQRESNPLDIHHLRQADGFRAAVLRYLLRVNEAAILSFTAIILGVLTALTWLFYPLPELVILSSALYVIFHKITSEEPQDRPEATDPQSPFVDAVVTITGSSKGFSTIPVVALGFFYSSIPFLMAFQLIGSSEAYILRLLARSEVNSHREISEVVLTALTTEYILGLCLAGGLAYWYWYRIVKRLPHFLTVWSTTDIKRILSDSDEVSSTETPTIAVHRLDFQVVRASWLLVVVCPFIRLW
jgi:hypothetical protein